MKVAISVPDELFKRAERARRRRKGSRSELYSRALAECLARHAPDEVTAAMDAAIARAGTQPEPSLRSAARRTLRRTQW